MSLLMVQKYINLQQKILWLFQIIFVKEMFQKIFQKVTWKKTGFNGYIYDFIYTIPVNDILDTHKYLMEKNNIV